MSGFNNAFGGNDYACILFLFRNSVVDSSVKYGFAVVGVFMLGVLNEFFALLRRFCINYFEGGNGNGSFRAGPSGVLALLYAVQMVNAYFLMLLVMTFDNIIFSFAIFGLMFGHFVALSLRDDERSGSAGPDDEPKLLLLKRETAELADHRNGSPCCGGAHDL